MKRIYVQLDNVKHSRYITSIQLPGYLIINTNAPIGKVVRLYQFQTYKLNERTISYLKSLPYVEGSRA